MRRRTNAQHSHAADDIAAYAYLIRLIVHPADQPYHSSVGRADVRMQPIVLCAHLPSRADWSDGGTRLARLRQQARTTSDHASASRAIGMPLSSRTHSSSGKIASYDKPPPPKRGALPFVADGSSSPSHFKPTWSASCPIAAAASSSGTTLGTVDTSANDDAKLHMRDCAVSMLICQEQTGTGGCSALRLTLADSVCDRVRWRWHSPQAAERLADGRSCHRKKLVGTRTAIGGATWRRRTRELAPYCSKCAGK